MLNKKIAVCGYLPNAHIARAAGYSPWDKNGAKYELVDGKLIHKGSFSNLPANVGKMLSQSFMFRKVYIEKIPTLDDLPRTIEIVIKS